MAIREILHIPHPILRRRAKRVRRIDKNLLELAHDMVDTMRDAGGVGLAANQVGDLRRLVVIQIPEEEEARIYINPEILRREGQREVEEGCLSHPGYRAMIYRSMWVRFGAVDHTEKVVKIKTDGLLAQAMEHEVDHLNGILYIDHLEDHTMLYKIEEPVPETDVEDDSAEEEAGGTSEVGDPEDPPASMIVE